MSRSAKSKPFAASRTQGVVAIGKPKLTKVLCAALAAMLILALPGQAEAKIIGYVTSDGRDMYEFDYELLLDAYVEKILVGKSVLFDEYMKHPVKLYLDDNNGYVDYEAALDAYVEALFTGKKFDIHEYTAGPKAVVVDVERVRVVTVEKGKLKFTDKIIGDPVEIALSEVNAALSAAALRAILEERAATLGLDLDKYNGLSEYGKTLAAAMVLERRGSGYTSVDYLRAAFAEEVQYLADNPHVAVLHEANSVATAAALRQVLESNAHLLNLDTSQYDELGNNSKSAIVQAVFARRGDGFAGVEVLQDIFAEEVANYLAVTEQVLREVNDAADPQALEAVLVEYGQAAGLEMDAYNLLIRSRQQLLLEQVFAALPCSSLDQLLDTFNNAVGAMLMSYSVITFSHYELTLKQMVDAQMKVFPVWDGAGGGWTPAPRSEVEKRVDPTNYVPDELALEVFEITAAFTLNVREQPTTKSASLGLIYRGDTYAVLDRQKGLEGTAPGTEGYWFKITYGEQTGWVCGKYADWAFNMQPNWFEQDDCRYLLQFLALSGPSGVTINDLRVVLQGKGILDGTEAAFYQASQEHGINEIFLTSLALHETGNGTSVLANGILFDPEDGREPRKVYNMFGIGAKDHDPIYLGAQYAYNAGWFSPEEAIIGGAKFAGEKYVNHPDYRQDTLYKMRWNPQAPGTHQYATDIGWAIKQTKFIRNIYRLVEMYHLKFDVPVYK